MEGITVTVDTSRLKGKFDRIRNRILNNLEPAVQQMGDVIANAGKHHAPYKTGTLRDSIQTRDIEVSGMTASAKVGPSDDVSYALIQEKGGFVPAEEPFIEPVTKKALAFNGRIYKHVKRHYIPAHPYMAPAVLEGRENAKAVGKVVILQGLSE